MEVQFFAWSSQGRGFFTQRLDRDGGDHGELSRTWFSERNFERRSRAIALAQMLKCQPIQVALAYVLAQPFPVIPLIGPRVIAELEQSLQAVDIALTPEQIQWLEAGDV